MKIKRMNLPADFHQLLLKNFPYPEFRQDQEAVLRRLWEGKNSLALMPTGSGKSLCYQFAAKVQPHLVVVLSPLIALMQDQTAKAQALGIRATEIHSNISPEERKKRQQGLAQGEFQLLFVTPERFTKSEFRDSLKSRQIFLLAVDEAHCVSLWSHDFRPDYGKIPEIREFLGRPPVLALTATATPDVQKDILLKLKIENDCEILSSGLERSNLALFVHEAYGLEEKLEKFFELFQASQKERVQGSVILYSVLIDTVQKISQFLRSKKIPHQIYHGELQASQRRRSLRDFMENSQSVMVATPAFGLGIDKPNIRQIFHFEIPSSLEEYYQQAGRAGRDGKLSECHFLFDEEDLHLQMEFIKWSHPEEEYVRQIVRLISTHKEKFQQDGAEFLREQISFKNKKDYRVEAALAVLERWGCLLRSEDMSTWTLVQEPTPEMFALEDPKLLMKSQNLKLLGMLKYGKNKGQCRRLNIYNYFGHEGDDCGLCDVCRSSAVSVGS